MIANDNSNEKDSNRKDSNKEGNNKTRVIIIITLRYNY